MKRTITVILLVFFTGGCSHYPNGTPEQICKVWVPIYPSRADVLTKGTTEQIAASNAANEVWCGVRPETKPVS